LGLFSNDKGKTETHPAPLLFPFFSCRASFTSPVDIIISGVLS
jgi:hypothetical protein